MINKNQSTNQEGSQRDGLPDIASLRIRGEKTALCIMLIIALVAFGGLYWHSRSKRSEQKPLEEVYTTASTHEVEPVVTKDEPKVVATPKPEVTAEQIAFIQAKQKELHERLTAPLMLVNTNGAMNKSKDEGQVAGPSPNDPNLQFMQQVSMQGSEKETATTIGPLNTVIAEGSFIHAILESATQSDLPGFLRATVSQPVYSEDGTKVLMPVGSRLIGQYKSGMLQGQSRIFIVWKRLITPKGISINLGSPGIDSLGVAGQGVDEIDRHFWSRFGTASLLSIIGAGASNVGVSNSDRENSSSTYRSGLANSFAHSANQSLQDDNQIRPTLKTYQGKPIMVFVAKDLYFANATQELKPKINVF